MKIEKRMNYIWFGELAKLNQKNIEDTRKANSNVPFYLYTHSDHIDRFQEMAVFCEERNITLVDIKTLEKTKTLEHVKDWLDFSEIGDMRFLGASDRLRYTLDGCYSDDDNIVGTIPFEDEFEYGFFQVLHKNIYGNLRHTNNLFGFSQNNLVRQLTDKLASHFHEQYFQRVKEALIDNSKNSAIAAIYMLTGQMLSKVIYYYFLTLAPNFSKLRGSEQRKIATKAIFYDSETKTRQRAHRGYDYDYDDEISPYQHLIDPCITNFRTTDRAGLSLQLASDMSTIREDITLKIKSELLDTLYKALSTPTSDQTLANSLSNFLNPKEKQALEVKEGQQAQSSLTF